MIWRRDLSCTYLAHHELESVLIIITCIVIIVIIFIINIIVTIIIIRQHLHLQVVGVYGSWHLGQLQVGLSKARRLCQCSSATITTLETLAMQMDGEPWLQAPAKLNIELKGQAHMLRRLNSEPLARMAHTVAGILRCLSTTVSLAYYIGATSGKELAMQMSHAQCSLILPE